MSQTSVKFKRAFIAVVAMLGLAVMPGVSVSAFAPVPQPGSAQLIRLFGSRYVALGDSVPAGLGLAPSTTASAEDLACGRSPSAYATTVAASINSKLRRYGYQMSSTNVACQGAVMDNLSQPQSVGGLSVQPQLDAAFAPNVPGLITLTMGANDAQWATFIGACFSAANCNTEANTTAANAYLATMQTKLSAALQDISARSHSTLPLMAVTGYYNPVSAQCVNADLTADEVAWLTQETTAFNSALRTATQQAGFASFAPVDFTGHDICSTSPWVQRPGVAGEPAPFHPNASGQQAMAQAVLTSLGL